MAAEQALAERDAFQSRGRPLQQRWHNRGPSPPKLERDGEQELCRRPRGCADRRSDNCYAVGSGKVMAEEEGRMQAASSLQQYFPAVVEERMFIRQSNL